MSVAAVAWKQAGEAIARSLPDMVYLFDAFLRRKARKFETISQDGTKFRRLSLTAALAVTCGATSYAIYKLDPFDGVADFMPSSERAVWTALVPLISAIVAYWIMRRTLREPIFATFLNLGLVTCIALTAIPGVLSLGGANASNMASDIRQFRAGHGTGTPVHRIMCASIEERAEIAALMRRLAKFNQEFVRLNSALMLNTREAQESARQMAPINRRLHALKAQIDQAGGPDRVDPAIRQQFEDTMKEGAPIAERGMLNSERGDVLVRQGLVLQDANLSTEYRALDLQIHQSTVLYRMLMAYPIATAFLMIAIIAGLLMWLFSAVIAWKLVVTPQVTRRKKALAGTLLVLTFLLVSLGSGILRSGFLEVFAGDLPTQAAIEAQIHDQFSIATPLCGKLDSHGLW